MKRILFTLLLSHFYLYNYSQAPNTWQLFLNKQKISVGILNNPSVVELDYLKLGNLKLKIFADTSKISFRKTILVMDTSRKLLYKEEFQTANIAFHLNENQFLKKWGKIPFVIYAVQVPNDPHLGIRVKPITQVVCIIKWIN